MSSEPTRDARPVRRQPWAVGIVAGAVALAALIAGSEFGQAHGEGPNAKLVTWVAAAVVVVAGVVATTRLSTAFGRMAAARSAPSAGGVVRLLSSIIGYLIVAFSVLSVLQVAIGHLLVGAGIAGVVLGIAAQQSLGNVFAGLVLIIAHPFSVGDLIRIRSGALGGIFDATVLELSLTYVSLDTADGVLRVPNSAMLAAGILRLPPAVDDGAAPGPGV